MSKPKPSDRCKAMVSDGNFHNYQCLKRAKMDGYCTVHHPDTIKAREAKKSKEFNDGVAARRRQRECVLALATVPNPEALPKLLEACARAAEDCHAYDEFFRIRREGGQMVGTQRMNPNTRRRLGEISEPFRELMKEADDAE